MRFNKSLGLILAAVLKFSVGAEIPLVYSVENTGATCKAPTLPQPGSLPSVAKLPDPYQWSNTNTRITSFDDWSCRRNEIKKEIENYEIGQKPDPPKDLTASLSGNRLTVTIKENGQTVTITANINKPSGSGPFPVIIGMNSATGSMAGSLFNGFIQVPFSHDQVATYSMNGQKNTNAAFYKMFSNLRANGDYSAWSWGISRIIDGLEKVKSQLNVDMTKIGVTGCSYAGKMALFAGAFDERIALTIAQESGGGGINAWRVADKIGNVEKIDNTNYSWFMQALKNNFGSGRSTKLPYDHHELVAMIAPRAVIALGNPDYVWLGDEAGYTSMMAAIEIYRAMGIEDRIGFDFARGHTHCQASSSQSSNVGKFVDRFLRGKNVDTKIRANSLNSNHRDWYSAWEGHKISPPTGGQPTTTTTKSTTTTGGGSTSGSCWSTKLGFPCCKGTTVVYTDTDGTWGVENNNWCGIKAASSAGSCWASLQGFPCCSTSTCRTVQYTDASGDWDVENGNWCGIVKGKNTIC